MILRQHRPGTPPRPPRPLPREGQRRGRRGDAVETSAAAAGGRRGAALVEMAIVLPFLTFAFLVALDYCRAFYTVQTVQNCAYAAALYASGTARAAPATT